MNMLVETSGDFMLVNPNNRQEIPWNRPAVVTSDAFIAEKLAAEKLILRVPVLPDGATDKEWAEWLAASDKDLDLAQASYLSKFEPAEAPKKK